MAAASVVARAERGTSGCNWKVSVYLSKLLFGVLVWLARGK